MFTFLKYFILLPGYWCCLTFLSVASGTALAQYIGDKRGKHFGRLETAVACASVAVMYEVLPALFSVGEGWSVAILLLLPGMILSGLIGALIPISWYTKPIVPKKKAPPWTFSDWMCVLLHVLFYLAVVATELLVFFHVQQWLLGNHGGLLFL